ncbi:hypothetical protein BDA99DRAFT_499201 [Phascolomyces articulosus]|uniref:Uncharacterized protein n=1 Tax=Phascolomyces articulosus TaxID=60185 RepID=A0AAD5KP61_9FUNG|nr:hypothetical protein BDA99DRAFT_499201 [Phascolomyces articulosus]
MAHQVNLFLFPHSCFRFISFLRALHLILKALYFISHFTKSLFVSHVLFFMFFAYFFDSFLMLLRNSRFTFHVFYML